MSEITRRAAITLGVGGGTAMLAGASSSGGQEAAGGVDAAKAELACLQGTWECLWWEQEGVRMSDADVARVSIVVSGDAYRSTTTGVWFEEGKLVVDSTKTPCHLDGHYGGNVRRAIYVRAGEYLTLCVGPSTEDGARPTDFVTAPGKDSVSLYVYKIKR